MTITSLQTPRVAEVLQRILAIDDGDAAARALVNAGRSIDGGFPTDLEPAEIADLFKDTRMSVTADGGELLYLLARTARARRVVEFGTSFGLSAIYLACAVRDNGGGTVIGTELQPEKAAAAQRNFDDAGVADLIELRIGDARETLAELRDPIDLLLLDGWPDLALPVLQTVETRLQRGSLVLIDDVDMDWGADLHGPVLSYLADQSDRYLSVRLGVGDGIQVCLRLA